MTKTHAQTRKPASGRQQATHPPVAARSHAATTAQVREILHGPRLQPKLTVGAPDDAFEREADRVAEDVMRMPEPATSGAISAGPPAPATPSSARPAIQRLGPEGDEAMRRQPLEEPEEEPEEPLQAKAMPGRIPRLTPDLQSRLGALPGAGAPLPPSERAFFEPRFGSDFGGVRLHTGSEATDLASRVEARAFTLGRSVVFGAGQYAPGTPAGRALLAHELTHLIQQRRGLAEATTVASTDGALEREAKRSADLIKDAQGGVILAPGGTPFHQVNRSRGALLQRQPSPTVMAGSERVPDGIPFRIEFHGVTRVERNDVLESLHAANPQALGGKNVVLHIIPVNKPLTDLPDFANLKGQSTPDGRRFETVRGVGGVQIGSTIHYAVGEEEFSSDAKYGEGFVMTHETGHVVEQFALTEEQRKELKMAYEARKHKGGPWLPPTAYTSSNVAEYFAQCTSAYFGKRPSRGSKNMYTPQWLKENDLRMYRLLNNIAQLEPLPPLRTQ